MHNRVTRRDVMAGLATVGFATSARAQNAATDYPKGNIKIIVSAAAGGGNDLIARILSERLPPMLGQTIVVENRPGAGNNLAAEVVYRSPPDGYTLLCSPPAPIIVNAALFKELRFDPTKMEQVSITSYIPNVLVVNPKSPFNTARDFIAYAKANPGKLSYASQGNGTTGHLTGALFEELIGAKHTHVPYGGAAPALNDVAAGHVDFMFADIGTVLPLAQGGLLRMLATLTKDPTPSAPDLPTIASVGLPELLSDTWTIFTAPPGTPLAIREKLSAAFKEVMFMPDVKARLEKIGVVPWGLDVKQSGELVARETKRWTDIIKRANVRID
jgi:tripartite-type tricarboxylate transporter receptor subunit TctC